MELTTDLIKDMFERFNREFFNSELKQTFSISISRTRKNLGDIKYMRSSRLVTDFRVSKMYDHTEESLASVVIHEMIHVWQCQIFPKSSGHDIYFVKKAEELSSLSGIKISITDSTTPYSKAAYKECMVAYMKHNGLYVVSIFKDSIVKEVIRKMMSHSKGEEIYIGKGRVGPDYTVRRKPKLYLMSKNGLDKIEVESYQALTGITKKVKREPITDLYDVAIMDKDQAIVKKSDTREIKACDIILKLSNIQRMSTLSLSALEREVGMELLEKVFGDNLNGFNPRDTYSRYYSSVSFKMKDLLDQFAVVTLKIAGERCEIDGVESRTMTVDILGDDFIKLYSALFDKHHLYEAA